MSLVVCAVDKKERYIIPFLYDIIILRSRFCLSAGQEKCYTSVGESAFRFRL
jgi:hypothetical protein